MATIRANCSSCGDVELTTRQVQVQVCASTEQSSYAFMCPRCHLLVNKPAETRVVEMLESAGVKVVTWHLPAELDEAHSGPPIDWDDILAFHFDLQRHDWLEQLTSF
jgi:hypothetical protein